MAPLDRSPRCASQQIQPVDVRFGSKADIAERETNVRFTPKSGHWNSVAKCLLCAKSGHWPLSASFESRQVSTPPPHGQPPRSHYLRLLPSKFSRDFVIHYAGPFGVIAESSAFGTGDEEGQSRLLVGGACRGEHDAAMHWFGFRATAAHAGRLVTARRRS